MKKTSYEECATSTLVWDEDTFEQHLSASKARARRIVSALIIAAVVILNVCAFVIALNCPAQDALTYVALSVFVCAAAVWFFVSPAVSVRLKAHTPGAPWFQASAKQRFRRLRYSRVR